uniref:Cytochrome b5 heme-binding domain-containing protein n=1 Tax=Chrysocystis fragilis TaxID=1411660 RepID=A0A7S0XMP2_9STRA
MRWLLAVGAAAVSLVLNRHRLELALGRFFRDVARSKARKRLYGNEYALVSMVFGKEEPLELASEAEAASVTLEELESATGEDGSPAYLSIRGRVYDVTAGEAFYGRGKPYHAFVARDATRAFALGCTAPRCISSDTEGLTEAQHREIDRWIELYETHDKYTFVGMLVDDPVDAIVDNLDE